LRFTPLVLFALAVGTSAVASSPSEAVVVVFQDALKVPEKDRCFMRWVVWPDEGAAREKEQYLLTMAQANLRSDQGAFGRPVRVVPRIYRLDVRDYGWDKRLEVWERFAALDPFFHMKLRLLEDRDVLGYWPGGDFDGKPFPKGPFRLKAKAGQTFDGPALWADPSVVMPDNTAVSAHDALRKMCVTEAPILFGPWWFVQTARQLSIRNKDERVGPYDWLGIRSRNDVFNLAGLDEKKASERFAAWRAVVEGGTSGISQQNRQIVLFRGATGLVWGTLDVFTEKGRGIAKRNLRPGEFLPDAEEWLLHLPNGTQGEALIKTKDGSTQASAPTEIGGDTSPLNVGRDPRVHTGFCMRCHGVDKDGIKPIGDWARDHFRLTKGRGTVLQDPDKKVVRELESLYLRDIERHVAADRAEYAFAYANLTVSDENPKGLTMAQFTKLYCGEWNRYVEERVTVERAALELGVGPLRLREAIFKYQADRGGNDLVIDAFIKEPPRKISRLEWEDSYGFAQVIVRGLKIPEIVSKVKGGNAP